MKLKVIEVVTYGGHNVSANGSVNLTLKASYSELVNSVALLQMLNCDVNVKAKMPDKKPIPLGMFRIKDVDIHGDGCSVIKLNGLSDFIEMDNLNNLLIADTETKEFKMLAVAEAEEETAEE